MMTHMGLEVSDGSENVITPREEWISKHKWSSSEDSIPEAHEPWSRSPPTQTPPTRTQGDDEDEDRDADNYFLMGVLAHRKTRHGLKKKIS
jgi:hypothetical protein